MGAFECNSVILYGASPAVIVSSFGACTMADTYTVLTAVEVASYCSGAFTCGSTAVALCDGSAWSACNCGIPAGYSRYTGTVTFSESSGTRGGSSGTSGGSTGTSGGSTGTSGGSSGTSGGSDSDGSTSDADEGG
jgi:hypothetical protein